MSITRRDGIPLNLYRWPPCERTPLQAWDAADAYLLRRAQAEIADATRVRCLVVNDNFGALALGLGPLPVTSWGDSCLARLALEHNHAANTVGAQAGAVPFVPGDTEPQGPWDLVLVRIPKSLELFAHQLHRLRGQLAAGAVVLSGAMIKHTSPRAYRLLERTIGPTTTSLGWRKARLARSAYDATLTAPAPPMPPVYELPGFGLQLRSRPGVFSAGRLDGGTQLLLGQLPDHALPVRAADLGCGNGVLSLALALRCRRATVLGRDASHLAIASARDNLAANADPLGDAAARLDFGVADGLQHLSDETLDLVVCNPPFHEDRTVGDQTAWRMLGQAHRALRRGGELRLVGNRHLGYHVKLKRVFGPVSVLASDRRFTVLSASKT